jgi:hypothetical protein
MVDAHESLSRDELLKLLDVYAKNWLAHDGCWFLAIEEELGTQKAIEFDVHSWERFAQAEAARIKRAFDLPDSGGLQALDRALRLRLYARVNRQEIEWRGPDRLVFRMTECRVQRARERKGLAPFPCIHAVCGDYRSTHSDALYHLPAGPGRAGVLRLEIYA